MRNIRIVFWAVIAIVGVATIVLALTSKKPAESTGPVPLSQTLVPNQK
jgi:hypothetical protein